MTVAAFAEPDKSTSKPVINRWFGRADGLPLLFRRCLAGVDRRPRHHRQARRREAHKKAMPVMLLTADDVKRWLYGSVADALELQKPAPDAEIRIVDRKTS